MKIVFATHNSGKLVEMRNLLDGFEVVSAEEAGVFDDVVEDGETFAENALKKARFVSQKTGEWAVADDSGICIAALDGRPGVYSARWAGENASDDEMINFTLNEMKDVDHDNRQAYFVSVAALVSPAGKEHVFEGRIDGKITTKPIGTPRKKLPYDLIFSPIGTDRTFAEMSDEEKNSLSHRGLAFQKLKKFLEEKKLLSS